MATKWYTSTSTSTANTAIGTMLSEAESLYRQAELYREEMDKLSEGDPQRPVYEKLILELLARARSLSTKVSTTSGS